MHQFEVFVTGTEGKTAFQGLIPPGHLAAGPHPARAAHGYMTCCRKCKATCSVLQVFLLPTIVFFVLFLFYLFLATLHVGFL